MKMALAIFCFEEDKVPAMNNKIGSYGIPIRRCFRGCVGGLMMIADAHA